MTTAAQLAGATTAEITAARTALSAHLVAAFPSLSGTAGPLADLVLGPAADCLAAVEHRAAAAEASLDPATALSQGGYDEDILAAALAGRGVTRRPATSAAGTAAFKFSTDAGRLVPSGYRLTTADGLAYATTEAARVLATGSTALTASDRVLVADPAGGYVAVVAVAASAAGGAYNCLAGTSFTPDSYLPNLSVVYAASNVSGGADAETDAQLLARLPAATAPRSATSTEGAAGVVSDAVAFSDVVGVGYGHPGMRRGRSVLTGQTPGRADLRVRTADQPGRVVLRVTATYQGLSGMYGKWRFAVGASAAPGWFVVERVVPVSADPSAGGYTQTVAYGFDLAGADPVPDVRAVEDAFFSRYLTATVDVVDPVTPTGGLVVGVSTHDYDAVLRVIPGVDTAQNAVTAAGVRAVGGDCLVRAAAPVMVGVTAVGTPQPGVTLTAAQVASAVSRAVNSMPIGSTLYGSVVGAAAVALLPAGTALALSNWSGVVYHWDGTTSTVTGTSELTVPTDWSAGLGDDTVAYYCDAAAVTASVT